MMTLLLDLDSNEQSRQHAVEKLPVKLDAYELSDGNYYVAAAAPKFWYVEYLNTFQQPCCSQLLGRQIVQIVPRISG